MVYSGKKFISWKLRSRVKSQSYEKKGKKKDKNVYVEPPTDYTYTIGFATWNRFTKYHDY